MVGRNVKKNAFSILNFHLLNINFQDWWSTMIDIRYTRVILLYSVLDFKFSNLLLFTCTVVTTMTFKVTQNDKHIFLLTNPVIHFESLMMYLRIYTQLYYSQVYVSISNI